MEFIWEANGQKALSLNTDMIQEYAIKYQCGLNCKEDLIKSNEDD